MSGGTTDQWFEARGGDEKDPNIPGFWTWEADYVVGGSFSGKSVGCQGIGKGAVSDGVIGRAGRGVHGVVALAKSADDRYDPTTAPPSALLALAEGMVTAIYARSYKANGVGPLPAITATSSGIGIAADGDPALQASGNKQGAAISASDGTGAYITGTVGVDVYAKEFGLRVTCEASGMKVYGDNGYGISGNSNKSYGGQFASAAAAQLLLQPTPDTLPEDLPVADAGALYVRQFENAETGVLTAQLWFCTVSGNPGPAQWTQVA